MSQQIDSAYRKIRSKIFHMELQPGDRVSELKLAREIGISRTPIHDAIRRLESEGLVIIKPNSGAQVRNLSEQEIRDLGTVRMAQDILAANLTSYYGSAADFLKLDRMIDECQETIKVNDKYQRIWKDIQFHLEIANITGNKSLISVQHNIYQQVHLVMITNLLDNLSENDPTEDHKAIMEAIRSGNSKEISRTIYNHLRKMFYIEDYIGRQYCG